MLTRTGVFYLGLITSLVPLVVLAGTLGAIVSQHRSVFVTLAGTIVIVLGLIMLANIPLPFLRAGHESSGSSALSVYALGTVYGLAGVCAGPLLGAVLFFAAGMTLPLLVLALLWGRLPFIRRLVRPRGIAIGRWNNTWTGIIGGMLTIGLGILLIVTDGTSSLGGLLGASEQVRVEGWAQRMTQGVPDALVLGVVVAIAGLGWLTARTHRRQTTHNSDPTR